MNLGKFMINTKLDWRISPTVNQDFVQIDMSGAGGDAGPTEFSQSIY